MKVTLLYLRDKNPLIGHDCPQLTDCPLSKLIFENGRYLSHCGANWVTIRDPENFNDRSNAYSIFRLIDVQSLPELEPGEIVELIVDVSVVNYNYVDYEENSSNKRPSR